MQLRNVLIGLLTASCATASPVSVVSEEAKDLEKRAAWTVYFYNNFNCDTSGSLGGYSSFGNFPCTSTNAVSTDFDPQGCTAQFFSDGNCGNFLFSISGSERCASSGGGPFLRSFRVNC